MRRRSGASGSECHVIARRLDSASLSVQGALTRSWRLPALALLWLVEGCAVFSGVRVESRAQVAAKPSNLAFYVEVHEDEKPVQNLSAANFRVVEDGEPLSPDESRLTLLAPEAVAASETLLLVDTSGTLSDGDRKALLRAVSAFLERVQSVTRTAVFAYAGSPRIELIGSYPRTSEPRIPGLAGLDRYRARDRSRDLRGSVVAGIAELDRRLRTSGRPLRRGTLVIAARGRDLSERTSTEELERALSATPHRVFVIAVGAREDASTLEDIGKSGFYETDEMSGAASAFERAALDVSSGLAGAYLVSYCSPARAGKHEASLEVEWARADGSRASGSVTHEFDATGFSAGCNPKEVPRFPSPGKDARRAGRRPKQRASPEERIVPPPDQPGYSP